jgi:NADPH:quinone reductase-like Zn-dependent oxidoreductase
MSVVGLEHRRWAAGRSDDRAKGADVSTTLRYAEAVRDGRLTIPIDRIMPLSEAAKAQSIAEKGGVAKVVLKP